MSTDDDLCRFPAAIIFDLDGTLVDSSRDLTEAVNRARAVHGLPPLPVVDAVAYVGDGVEAFVRRALQHESPGMPLDPDVGALALGTFRAYYGDHCVDHTRCYPGVEAMLDRCGGRPLFLATNKERRFTLRILAGLGLAERFAAVVAGDDGPARKPAPAHLAACLAGWSIEPRLVAVVGDGPTDIRAARAHGSVSVAVTYGLTPPARLLAERPDLVADDPAAIIGCLGLI